MKSHFIALLLGLFSLTWSLGASAQGIDFFHGTWAEALEKSRKEGKPIFLDAYTSWCGPCKLMVKNVFPDAQVAEFYNARFVNLKMDMEQGEGPAIAERYGIDVYPTLIFVDSVAKIVHRVSGYHNPEDFVRLGQLALDPARNLGALLRRYKSGERTPGLLLDLARAKSAAFDPSSTDLANEYFKTQSDLSTPENIEAVFQLAEDPFSEGFKFLIQNQALFTPKHTQKALDLRIEEIFDTYLMRHPALQLGEIQRLYASCYPLKGERLASSYRMTYYRQREDMVRFAESAMDHYARYPTTDADELNEIAYLFWENVTHPEHLEKALEWAEQSVRAQEFSYNQETLARLYAKLGKKKAAEKAIRRAIQVAAANGEATEGMQLFLVELGK